MRNAFAWVHHLLLQDDLDRRKVTFLWWEDTARLIRGDVHTPPRFSRRIPLRYIFYYMLLIRPRCRRRWRRLELPIPPTYNWNNPRYNRPGYRIRVRNVVPWIILLSTGDRKNELERAVKMAIILAVANPCAKQAWPECCHADLVPRGTFHPSLPLSPSPFCPPSFRILDAGAAWINNSSMRLLRRTCESATKEWSFLDK